MYDPKQLFVITLLFFALLTNLVYADDSIWNNLLMLPVGLSRFLKTRGRGVQIYACDLLTFQHTWVGERFVLTKEDKDDIIGNGGGDGKAMWHYEDNSFVTGILEREVEIYHGDSTGRRSNQCAENFHKLNVCVDTYGLVNRIADIHRVNTKLGKPVGRCNETTPFEMPFEADYYFWRRGNIELPLRGDNGYLDDYKQFDELRCKNYDFNDDFVEDFFKHEGDLEADRIAAISPLVL